MAAAAKKDPDAIPTPTRCGPADIQELTPWVAERLRDRYPGTTMQQMNQWLRTAMFDNQNYLIRTPHAIGLFALTFAELGQVWAEEKFVLTHDGYESEGAEIYRAARAWMTNMGVREVKVECVSDVPREAMTTALGAKVTKREVSWIRIR